MFGYFFHQLLLLAGNTLTWSFSQQRRAVRDFGFDDFEVAPKLAPDPVAAPEAKGVENNELPAEADCPKDGAVLPKGVLAELNIGADDEPKRVEGAVAPEELNKEDV